MPVAPWVKTMCESLIGSTFKRGQIVNHPEHGRVVITAGQLWGQHGLSNYWHWRKANKLGIPYGETYRGYGW